MRCYAADDVFLLAELLAQTDRLRIVATLMGSGNFLSRIFLADSLVRDFKVVGGRAISSSAAAFFGTNVVGSEMQFTA